MHIPGHTAGHHIGGCVSGPQDLSHSTGCALPFSTKKFTATGLAQVGLGSCRGYVGVVWAEAEGGSCYKSSVLYCIYLSLRNLRAC